MKYLPVNLATSHPHYDTEGNAYNIGTSIAEKGKTKYILFKVPAVLEKGTESQNNHVKMFLLLHLKKYYVSMRY